MDAAAWVAIAITLAFGLGHGWIACGWWHLRRQAHGDPAPAHGISVITAARNERHNLPALYTCLCQQSHSDWVWLVVDDRSTDDTGGWLAQLAGADPRVRVIHLTETAPGWAPKKFALQTGIHAAEHSRILLTDADCRPPVRWVERMAAALATADLVIGYGPSEPGNGIRPALAQYDAWWIAVQYFAAAGWGVPYMAVGRSLALRRPLWDALGGYASHRHILSGDDDLWVQQAHGAGARLRCVWQSDAAPSSAPPPSWRAWLRQKQRHLRTAPAYPWPTQLVLAIWALVQVLAWLALPVLALSGSAVAGVAWLSGWFIHLGLLWWLRAELPVAIPPALRLAAGPAWAIGHLVLAVAGWKAPRTWR